MRVPDQSIAVRRATFFTSDRFEVEPSGLFRMHVEAAASVCGQYPKCKTSVCWGKQQRCTCKKDVKNLTCATSACRHDKTCP